MGSINRIHHRVHVDGGERATSPRKKRSPNSCSRPLWRRERYNLRHSAGGQDLSSMTARSCFIRVGPIT